jgi:PAS domain S-box-containing protein
MDDTNVTIDADKMSGLAELSPLNLENYRKLVEFCPYGIAVTSESKIVYINQAGAQIHGAKSPSEIIGKSLASIIPPEFMIYVQERVANVEVGVAAPLRDEKLLRIDGTSVDVELGAIPFVFNGKEATYAVFREITERKNAEARLKEKIDELERMNTVTIDRELKMVEMKKEMDRSKVVT